MAVETEEIGIIIACALALALVLTIMASVLQSMFPPKEVEVAPQARLAASFPEHPSFFLANKRPGPVWPGDGETASHKYFDPHSQPSSPTYNSTSPYNAATESANNEFEGVSILLNAAPVNTTAVPEIFITQNTVPILDEEEVVLQEAELNAATTSTSSSSSPPSLVDEIQQMEANVAAIEAASLPKSPPKINSPPKAPSYLPPTTAWVNPATTASPMVPMTPASPDSSTAPGTKQDWTIKPAMFEIGNQNTAVETTPASVNAEPVQHALSAETGPFKASDGFGKVVSIRTYTKPEPSKKKMSRLEELEAADKPATFQMVKFKRPSNTT